MIAFIVAHPAWSWLIAGALLLGLELLAPGMFMLWLGLAAILVGLITLVMPWSVPMQFLAFAILALAAVPAWRRLAKTRVEEAGETFLNRRAEALVGRVFTLEKPIVGGHGTVRVDDTVWRVTGPDTPAGQVIRIARAEGAVLTVETA